MAKITKAALLSEGLSGIHVALATAGIDVNRLKALLDMLLTYMPLFISIFSGSNALPESIDIENVVTEKLCEIQTSVRASHLTNEEKLKYLALMDGFLSKLSERVEVV